MKYSVAFHPAALQDLQNIETYIRETLNNPTAATKIISKILHKCESLSLFPNSTPIYLTLHDQDVRLIHVASYIIAYTVDDSASSVRIQAVVYCRRDLTSILARRN